MTRAMTLRFTPSHRSAFGKRLTFALTTCFCVLAGISGAHAQSTGSAIFGAAPAGAVVSIQGTSGAHRHAKVKSNGRYTITSVPLGIYTATLTQGDTVLDKRPNIALKVGGGAEVDFACPHDQCAATSGGTK